MRPLPSTISYFYSRSSIFVVVKVVSTKLEMLSALPSSALINSMACHPCHPFPHFMSYLPPPSPKFLPNSPIISQFSQFMRVFNLSFPHANRSSHRSMSILTPQIDPSLSYLRFEPIFLARGIVLSTKYSLPPRTASSALQDPLCRKDDCNIVPGEDTMMRRLSPRDFSISSLRGFGNPTFNYCLLSRIWNTPHPSNPS